MRHTRGAQMVSAVVVAGMLAAACSSMDSIDRHIQRELTQASSGIDAMTPTITGRPKRERLAEAYRKTPPTTNPSASELPFTPADPNLSEQEVLKRLENLYSSGPDARPIDLEETFRLGQSSSREYLRAVEDYMLIAIRMLVEQHRWTPRLFDDITANTTFDSSSGRYRAALDLMNQLRVSQRLPFGGTVEAAYIASSTQQLVDRVGDGYTQASQLVLSAEIPLLRNAGIVAQEDLIQTERDVVYAARAFERTRRTLLVDFGRDYFNLVAQQDSIRNQEARLRSVQGLLEQRRALVEAGRSAAFEARNVEQNVLRSEATLISSREAYKFAVDRFKVRLGLDVSSEVLVRPVTLSLPQPEITLDLASIYALEYRLDYQNQKDRVDDRRRAVEVSRNQLLPDLDVAARAALNTEGSGGRESSAPNYDLDDTDYAIGMTFSLPLDREIERLNLRSSMIALQSAIRDLDRSRDDLVLEARTSLREVERSKFALDLQEQAVEINQLRLDELEIKADEVDAQQRLDAENELLQSRNDRDQAVRDLRVAILQYLLATGQMRVKDDGTFQPLEGMNVRVEDGPISGSDPVQVPPESPDGQ